MWQGSYRCSVVWLTAGVEIGLGKRNYLLSIIASLQTTKLSWLRSIYTAQPHRIAVCAALLSIEFNTIEESQLFKHPPAKAKCSAEPGRPSRTTALSPQRTSRRIPSAARRHRYRVHGGCHPVLVEHPDETCRCRHRCKSCEFSLREHRRFPSPVGDRVSIASQSAAPDPIDRSIALIQSACGVAD